MRGATGNFRPGKVGVNDQSLGASFLDRLLSLTFGNGQANAPDPISVKPLKLGECFGAGVRR